MAYSEGIQHTRLASCTGCQASSPIYPQVLTSLTLLSQNARDAVGVGAINAAVAAAKGLKNKLGSGKKKK